jgi:muramoyltetrapeptide carboxypeptidase LdcA involved in peptidoglycan recycling
MFLPSLKTVLPRIINVNQTGYVKYRFIGFNLRQIQDIIDYADIYKIEGAILFVEFTKAFDSLEWNFMLNTLKHFEFNEYFINWVKTLTLFD